jgi:hypothetical protein
MATNQPAANGTKKETFNQLDEKFQVLDHHDPEIIFPEEYEMIKELRAQRPELEKESDKFLCVFLCARRHIIPDTLKLLDKYTKKRKELGFDVNPPSLKDEALKKHFETGIIIQHKGAHDKFGRMLNYVNVSKDKPKDRPITVLYAYTFWDTSYQIQTETLKTLRNGCIMVIDFKGFGLSNVDLSPKGIEFSKALSGVFPRRIRKVYLLNGGWLLKLISQAATLLLSKKLIDRMEIGDAEGLKNYINDEWLLTNYSGKWAMSPKDMAEAFRKHEEGMETQKNIFEQQQLQQQQLQQQQLQQQQQQLQEDY